MGRVFNFSQEEKRGNSPANTASTPHAVSSARGLEFALRRSGGMPNWTRVRRARRGPSAQEELRLAVRQAGGDALAAAVLHELARLDELRRVLVVAHHHHMAQPGLLT